MFILYNSNNNDDDDDDDNNNIRDHVSTPWKKLCAQEYTYIVAAGVHVNNFGVILTNDETMNHVHRPCSLEKQFRAGSSYNSVKCKLIVIKHSVKKLSYNGKPSNHFTEKEDMCTCE